MGLFTKLFGTRSEREVKKLQPQLNAILALEQEYKVLSDEELRAKSLLEVIAKGREVIKNQRGTL